MKSNRTEDAQMKKRILGKGGLEVSAVGLGCMGMSHACGRPLDDKQAGELIAAALDLGITYFDTAEVYGPQDDPHHNERLLGAAPGSRRGEAVISTKFGIRFDESAPTAVKPVLCDSRPETIRRSLEGSLRRLGTEHIDLYYQHGIDPQAAPEEVAETMSKLIAEGKILHWGVSQAPLDCIRRADKVCRIEAVQSRYSIMSRRSGEMFPELEKLGTGFVAFSPLANGFLSGACGANEKFDGRTDCRASMAQFKPDAVKKNSELLGCLEDLASAHHATKAQIALSWMLCRNPHLVPIPGTTKKGRLEENAGAADAELSSSEVAEIDRRLSEIPMSGVFEGVKTGSGH
jgi:aryl-alcohol dehydrogenase-like predicted oxidoreductase